MSKQITVKYYSGSNNVREPYQASEDAAGCDVFAAETKTIMPKSNYCISLEMMWAFLLDFMANFFQDL